MFKPNPNIPLLDVKDLQVEFSLGSGKNRHKVKAVRGVNFSINAGERVAIVGESGSGKSTTAHALINLLPGTGKITGGSIKWAGHSELNNEDLSPVELVGNTENEFVKLRGSGIGLVPQDPMSNLNPVWRIGYQVEEALKANGAKDKAGNALAKSDLKSRVAELLENAGLQNAESRMKQFPHEFSGGMKQRVLISIGLANHPKLLIADEPTSALDVTVQKTILDHLDELTSTLGTAVLFITHDLGLAAERAQKLIVMYKGQIVESGPAMEILQNPQHPYTQELIAAAPSIASQRLVSNKTPEQIAAATQAERENRDIVDGKPNILHIQDLTKEFNVRGAKGEAKRFRAVDSVSFSVRQGNTTAIVGESGSGKSTVANMLLGLLEPTSGKIDFEGTDLAAITKDKKEAKKYRRRVQPVFQNPYGSLDPMFSIGRAIREPLDIHRVGTSKERDAWVLELLDLVKLPQNVSHRYPYELSGGQRQRIAIARALALKPEMLVLDEAVSALDVLVQEQILTLLNNLQEELGLTYVFITHDLAVVRIVADNVIVMQNGKVVEKGVTEDVFFNPQQVYTQKLLEAIPGRHIL